MHAYDSITLYSVTSRSSMAASSSFQCDALIINKLPNRKPNPNGKDVLLAYGSILTEWMRGKWGRVWIWDRSEDWDAPCL